MGGDPNRAFDGEIHGLLTYRESHPQALRQQIEAWTEQNFYTTCQVRNAWAIAHKEVHVCVGETFLRPSCSEYCWTGSLDHEFRKLWQYLP